MRWKLQIISSLIAAFAGTSGLLALNYFFNLYPFGSPTPYVRLIAPLFFPFAVVVGASLFVYRHTARRRKLQSVVAALLSLILTIAAFTIASFIYRYRAPRQSRSTVAPTSRRAA